jgi:nucleoside-diphosphate-sugar epimerase
MKALVTGATGFIGRYLVAELLQRGYAVRILARTPERVASLRAPGLEVVVGDVTNPASLAGIALGMDVVFHLASAMSEHDPAFDAVDVQGTQYLLSEAERSQVRRFVYPGTLASYRLADTRDGVIIDESSPFDDTGLLGGYARSKAQAEEAVLAAQRRGKLECVIIRLGWTCGVGAAVFPAHVCRVVKPNLFLMFGDGSLQLPFTYIDNAVEALILAATVPDIAGESFNIIDDGALTQQQYMNLYVSATGTSPRVIKLPRAAYQLLGAAAEMAAALRRKEPTTTRYRVRARLRRARWDCSKAHRLLRWQPRVPLRAGLEQIFKAHAGTGPAA